MRKPTIEETVTEALKSEPKGPINFDFTRGHQTQRDGWSGGTSPGINFQYEPTWTTSCGNSAVMYCAADIQNE